MTEKGKQFMREYASRFTPPRDWGQKARDEDTSTLPGWLSWLDRERTSLDIVTRVLDQFHKQDKRPTLADVKRGYAISAGRGTVGGFTPRDRCDLCDGDGVLTVPCVSMRGVVYVLPRPGPYRTVFSNSTPCKCSAGRSLNAKSYQYNERQIERHFLARRSLEGIFAMQRDCAALVKERGSAADDPPAHPADAERDGVFEDTTQEMNF